MENRKSYLSSAKVCRFCLSQDESLQSLYDRSRSAKKSVPLPLKILSCVSIEAFPSDKMPSYICKRCSFFMDIFYEYKHICRLADETILKFVQSGNALEPPFWPQKLTKTFRLGAKDTLASGVVKTVVEGGATVEVTSHNISDSEDDDENVYNVKIEDGPDEGSSACVKVVTAPEKPTTLKRSKELEKGQSSQVQKGSDGRWACDACDCTYPLQQLLDLHKASKHRERNVACDQCQAKFFTNADLQSHMVRHSDETPFQCVACDKKFKRLVLLKRHERLIHSDLDQRKCPHCPATFLSLEEFEAHQTKHAGKEEPSHACPKCGKKFHKKNILDRHQAVVHSTGLTLSCKYCPERYSTVSKLAKHVREHAGERPYPCKYCDKCFSKSHHYTRHVRLKHPESIIRSPRDSFSLADQYRCDQCEDSFASQDELIYHSALHATENLICPLCQEKFDNVGEVTAHIKSHSNGMEFMCVYCELVFTTKQKLDHHLRAAHNEELSVAPESGQDENSMEMDAEDDDDDNPFNVKDEGDHMVVEVKKTDSFMLPITKLGDHVRETLDNTNSEESESDATFAELETVDPLAAVQESVASLTIIKPPEKPADRALLSTPVVVPAPVDDSPNKSQISNVLRKAQEIKGKIVQPATETPPEKLEIVQKKQKPASKDEKLSNKVDSIISASDKSLRLLEKELQELKRTTRNEVVKTPAKAAESVRSSGRRSQLHIASPKLRAEEKKPQTAIKPNSVEKKAPERRAIKENKEPKETKETKVNDKEAKVNTSVKDDPKEKDTPKGVVKNGAADKNTEEVVRRSTRPCKVKDYAKMVRTDGVESDETDDDDDEYTEVDKSSESRSKQRRSSVKPATPATAPAKGVCRKRGRPRKQTATETPAKMKKEDETEGKSEDEDTAKEKSNIENKKTEESTENERKVDATKQVEHKSILVSPSGQTLKKVPVKALPPGVKALPLAMTQRPMGPRELCEMQIGKKMVKVQKIVMTKAEVEAMTKKGLLEMKGNTMVLKQGIKLPTDAGAIKSLVGESDEKESPKNDKAVPTRCELNEET